MCQYGSHVISMPVRSLLTVHLLLEFRRHKNNSKSLQHETDSEARITLLIKIKEEQCLSFNFTIFAWKFSNRSMAHQEVFHPLDGLP